MIVIPNAVILRSLFFVQRRTHKIMQAYRILDQIRSVMSELLAPIAKKKGNSKTQITKIRTL